jgi:hypothetical protein
MLRVTTRQGLLSGQFRHGGIYVRDGAWSSADPEDKEQRAALLAYVPSHIRLAQGQEEELAKAGLALDGGAVVDVRAAKAAEAAEKAKAEKAKKAEKA